MKKPLAKVRLFSWIERTRQGESRKKYSRRQNVFLVRKSVLGFLTVEIMIAISIFILFTISVFSLSSSMQGIKIWSLNELDLLKNSVHNMDNALYDFSLIKKIIENKGSTALSLTVAGISYYGNNSLMFNMEPFSTIKSDLIDGWGDSSCSPRITFDQSKISFNSIGVFLGAGNVSTDIEVRDSIVYLTSDSSTQSQFDFFIIDAHDYENPRIISSINTGPGLASLAVAGPYVYVVNTSSISQLQIIDIHDRNFPHIVSSLKLPLPEASTTPSKANSIFYKKGVVYLGTNKWDGPEFYTIDVSNPLAPVILGSLETSTLVNDIYVNGNTAYLATSDENQMRIVDITNKSNMSTINTFSSSGWQTQQGKVIEYFEGNLGLGRTVGGVNKLTNYEVFIFSTTSISTNATSGSNLFYPSQDYSVRYYKDIPGGIYGLLNRAPYIYLLTHAPLAEFQVWDSVLDLKVYQKSLDQKPVAMSCDLSTLYFATGDEKGLSILKLE